MRKSMRLLSLVLVMCILLGATPSAFADEDIALDEIVPEFNYDELFVIPEDPIVPDEVFYFVMINDTANFLNELAFRDAEIKQYVLDNLTGNWVSSDKLLIMRDLVVGELSTDVMRTKSEQALLEAMLYALRYRLYSIPGEYRDPKTLFQEADAVYKDDFLDSSLGYELAEALVAEPVLFVQTLAVNAPMQEAVMMHLCLHTNERGNVLVDTLNKLLLTEPGPPILTERELWVVSMCLTNLEPYISPPVLPSDPDPEELALWLEQKYPPIDPSLVVEVTSPVQTQPVTDPTEENAPQKTGEPEDVKQTGPGWISAICFIIAAFAAGCAVGSHLRKKPKATPAPVSDPAPIPEQAPAKPAATFPKRAYCPAPLEKETQARITAALREKYQEYSVDWYSIKNPHGTCRCYGTDRGVDIILYAGGFRLEIPDTCTVAEETFHFGTAFELYAHRDGILTALDTAFQNGLVSREAIAAAAAMHKSLYKE